MAKRGRIEGKTNKDIYECLKNILLGQTNEGCRLYVEVIVFAVEDKYREVKSRISRHRRIKLRDAEKWRLDAIQFLDGWPFKAYCIAANLNIEWVRSMISVVDKHIYRKRQMKLLKRSPRQKKMSALREQRRSK